MVPTQILNSKIAQLTTAHIDSHHLPTQPTITMMRSPMHEIARSVDQSATTRMHGYSPDGNANFSDGSYFM